MTMQHALSFASVSKNAVTVAVEVALTQVVSKAAKLKQQVEEEYNKPSGKQRWLSKARHYDLTLVQEATNNCTILNNAKEVLENVKVLCAITDDDKILLSDYGLSVITHYGGEVREQSTFH